MSQPNPYPSNYAIQTAKKDLANGSATGRFNQTFHLPCMSCPDVLLLRQAIPKHLPPSAGQQTRPSVELRKNSVFADLAQPPSDRGESTRMCG